MKATDLIKTTKRFIEKHGRAYTEGKGCLYWHYGKNCGCAVGQRLHKSFAKNLVRLLAGALRVRSGALNTTDMEALGGPQHRVLPFSEWKKHLKKPYRGFPVKLWIELQQFHDLRDHWDEKRNKLNKVGERQYKRLLTKWEGVTNSKYKEKNLKP